MALGTGVGRTGLFFLAYLIGALGSATRAQANGPAAAGVQDLAQVSSPRDLRGSARDSRPALDQGATALSKLGGVWKGHYICQLGRTAVTLSVDASKSDDVTGYFYFYAPPDNPTVPTGEIFYGLSFNAAANVIDMRSIRWIQQPEGFSTVPIRVRLSKDGRRLSGTVRSRGCGEIILDRVAADDGQESAGKAQDFSRVAGVWEGYYTCRFGRTGATLTVEQAAELATATASLRFYGGPDNPSTPDGEILYGLNYNPAASAFDLRVVRWLEQPDGYSASPIHVRLSDDGERLRGAMRNRDCGEVVFTRAGASKVDDIGRQQENQQTKRVQTSTPYWYGSIKCARGQIGEVEMQLAAPEGGGNFKLRAVANFPNSMTQGTVERTYIGERTPGTTDEITFVVEKQVRNGVGQPQFGNFQFNEQTGKGRFSTGGCQELTVEKESSDTGRRTVTATPPEDGGSYFAVRRSREKCEALIRWTDRLAQEYPDRDFYRSTKKGDEWRKIKLFGDDDFVPVFGRPFDLLPLSERKDIDSFVRNKCYLDPFTKDRMTPYRSAVERPFDDDPKRQLASDGYSSTLFAISTMRRVRNEVRAEVQELNRLEIGQGGFEVVAKKGIEVRSAIEGAQHALWPSEVTVLATDVEKFLEARAVEAANDTIANLEAERDPRAALANARMALSESDRDFLKYVPQSEKSKVTRRISLLRQKSADQIAEPLLSKARNAPVSIAGVQLISNIMSEDLRSIGELESDLRSPIEDELARERSDRLGKLTHARTAELEGYPPGLNGLEKGASWWRSFEADFSRYASLEEVKAAISAFRADRTRRLKEAAREFEGRVESTPAEAVRLAREYLSLPEDSKLPISLDYAFVVEAAGKSVAE